MKFRITTRDFVIFIIFAVMLLLLSSILVVNFYSLGNEGTFYGLNPFKGLLLPYLPVTLIVFIVAIIVIFTSVSSYIFDKEKGKGIGLLFGEKKEKGYSRWCTDKEMKAGSGITKVDPTAETIDAAGVPIINNAKEIWCDNGQYHSLILGSTGCGKSESIVKPTLKLLAKKGESMVITDPKGELYRETAFALKKRGYNVIVLNFREPQNGNAWNPLSLPYQYFIDKNVDKATELLEDVASNILVDGKGNSDPFWEKQASDYFSGLAMGLFQDAKEEEVNLNSINYMATVGEEKMGASRYINEYFNNKSQSDTAAIFASGTVNAPNETKGGILSVFRQKIRIFSTRDNLSEMLSYSDFDIRKIGTEKTAVFMIIHDEKTTYHALATIFVKQCYESLIDVAQQNGGKLKFRTNFILDEFANMPPLKDVDSMVSAARSRDIRFSFIIQNFAQLKDVYGDNVAEVIKGNCGNIIYLISTEMSALEEISKMCGEVKSKEKDKTASTPLVTVTDLQKMKLGEAIYKRIRMDPFKSKLAPDFDVNWGFEKTISEYPTREVKPVNIFDLKEFVKKIKDKKLEELGASTPGFSGGSLFGDKPMFDSHLGDGMKGNDLFKPASNGKPFDLDEMMKDIDRRIAEIEAEEKAEAEKVNTSVLPKNDIFDSPGMLKPESLDNIKPVTASIKDGSLDNINQGFVPINIYNDDDEIEMPKRNVEPILNTIKEDTKIIANKQAKEVETKQATPKIENNDTKPIINVDADSIIVNENVVSDDEFFDDFFGDDE